MTLLQSTSTNGREKRSVGRCYQSLWMMLAISAVMLGGICSRLVYLQLIDGNHHRQLAENNRIRIVPNQPVRGNIFDRYGNVLASSKLSHAVFLWPMAQKPQQWPATLEKIAPILDIPQDQLQQRLDRYGYDSPMPLRVQRGITPEQITALEEYSSQLPGVEVQVEAVRTYPNKEVAAHILGYTGEITEEELDKVEDKGYRLGDIVGQMGIEAAEEERLRGKWGGKQLVVDNQGRVLRMLGEKPSVAGKDLQLTLDLELQKAAEAALGGHQGAVVALDPRNGEVLAMVSRPTFDPNVFSRRMTDADWEQLQSEDHPFVNRALQGFPPASTFKIVTTTAAIESGIFPPDTVLPTYPYIVAGGIEFWDWNRAGFGPLDFPGAMAWSSDTFFYQIAQGIGEKPLIDWTRRFGFGSKTGIELATEEAEGLVPDEKWKQEVLGEDWFQGDSINMSIGQGFLQTSPLQQAVMFAVPASGGYRVKPHLVMDNRDAKSWRESLNLKPETVEILKEGLRLVITNGTGTEMNSASIPPAAGKSGTAEAPPYESHTWFGAYAPIDNPEIVVVVFGEHSGLGGGKFAAPKVRQVMEAYFNLKAIRSGEGAKPQGSVEKPEAETEEN
ncbi:MAG TPA: penicillin-binding protein 2 [Oscillatoriales cyanobacterium M59_W2019_021]|nr:penicillin-binding protein 2 [Oscillatoriales cyanobacterium M4454_W2019_049]HIK50793.1 penicillin-binding protein 2 [Oscillatoriales cyanobacterium M59_W2019_021]